MLARMFSCSLKNRTDSEVGPLNLCWQNLQCYPQMRRNLFLGGVMLRECACRDAGQDIHRPRPQAFPGHLELPAGRHVYSTSR